MSTRPSLGQRQGPTTSCGPLGRFLRVSEPQLPPLEMELTRLPCRAPARTEDVGQAASVQRLAPPSPTFLPLRSWGTPKPTPHLSGSLPSPLSRGRQGVAPGPWRREKAKPQDQHHGTQVRTLPLQDGWVPLALSQGPTLQHKELASLRPEAPSDWRSWPESPISGPTPRSPDSTAGPRNLHFHKQPGCLCVPVLGRPTCHQGRDEESRQKARVAL